MHTAAVGLLHDYTWQMLDVEAPGWYKNPLFGVIFHSRSAFDRVTRLAPLTLSPGLTCQLFALKPPGRSFFKNLLYPQGRFWAIYAHTMKKPGVKGYRVYFGSGTDTLDGVRSRTKMYKPFVTRGIPRMVRTAFRQGYRITHTGLLCWTPIPRPRDVPRVRALFLALEATLTCMFFVQTKHIEDMYWKHIFPWVREDVEYSPLCCRSALKETIRGYQDLSADQLEDIYTKRISHRRSLMRGYARTHKIRKLAKNAVAFRKKNAEHSLKHYNKDTVAGASKQRTRKAAIRSAARHPCGPCGRNFDSPSALKKHLGTDRHASKLALQAAGAV